MTGGDKGEGERNYRFLNNIGTEGGDEKADSRQ